MQPPRHCSICLQFNSIDFYVILIFLSLFLRNMKRLGKYLNLWFLLFQLSMKKLETANAINHYINVLFLSAHSVNLSHSSFLCGRLGETSLVNFSCKSNWILPLYVLVLLHMIIGTHMLLDNLMKQLVYSHSIRDTISILCWAFR